MSVAARSGTPAATAIVRIDEYTPGNRPRSTVAKGMRSADNRCSIPLGPAWITTRSGRSRAMSSASGRRNVPIFGKVPAASGNRQNVDTPTTRSPSPSAKSASVMLGDVETMRVAGAAPSVVHHKHAMRTVNRNMSCFVSALTVAFDRHPNNVERRLQPARERHAG